MRSCGFLLGVVGLAGCFSTSQPFQLPLHGLAARSTFPRLAQCAKSRSLQPIEQGDSVTIQLDGDTAIAYLIQGEQYNMIVTLGGSLSEADRASRGSAAQQLGNEIFGCSMGASGVASPTADPATGVETSFGPMGGACRSVAGPPCSDDGQCESQNCSASVCQSRSNGSMCRLDGHCDSRNCHEGCCQPRSEGALCGSDDHHCNSLNCSGGRCRARSVGALCGNQDSHCDSLNCTNGRCQARGPGAICGSADSHCESYRCVEGFCK